MKDWNFLAAFWELCQGLARCTVVRLAMRDRQMCLFSGIGLLAMLVVMADPGAVLRAQEKESRWVKLDSLQSAVPAEWVWERPETRFRLYQFRLPRAAGDSTDAQLVVFYFGPQGGGGVAENLKRWKEMFEPPAGKTIEEVSTVEKFQVAGVPITYLDVRGTYLEKTPPFAPNAKIVRHPNYRRLGVIFSSAQGPYFITLTGPERTVEQHKLAFDR
jgi:hypothetical protein